LPEPVLALEGVAAGYGEARVLAGIAFELEAGQALALLGRNGAGKTTLINTLVGLTTLYAGRIRLAGRDITHLASDRRAAAGIGWVPQERNIFASLSVEENLSAVARPGPWTVSRVYDSFSRLRERRGNLGSQLSGGEQQMLAVGRALVLNPRVLLLDEPLEGLAPIIVEELLRVLGRLIREEGMSVLLVEQHAHQILPLTERAVILERGTVVYNGASPALAADAATLETFLGAAGGRRGQLSRP
jgi:branched-chain amino acid transport system ATP-binding protein